MKFLIVGGGRVGLRTARILTEEGYDVVIVEQDSEKARRARDEGFRVVEGDGNDEDVLEEAGITTAEAVAAWFAGHSGPPPRASAHICCDNDSIVRCVRPEHVAWAAPGANHDGYQVELAGRARQTEAEWLDNYSDAMLRLVAPYLARVAERWQIPIRWLSVDEVRDGERGFCGHAEVSKAFGKSTHWDPGDGFPWEYFLELVMGARHDHTVG